MKNDTLKRLARGFSGLTILFILVEVLVVLSATPEGIGSQGDFSDDFYPVIAGITVISYLVLSNLILDRTPRHIIGWLFLLVGFFIGMQVFGLAITTLKTPNFPRLIRIVNVLTGDLWIPSFIIPITLVLQYFPDGRLPSRHWWPVTVAAVLGMLSLYLGYILHPWPWLEDNITDCCNPLAIEAGERFFGLLAGISSLLLAVGILGSLVSVVVRFRRSQGIERAQMKWLVYTAGTVLLVFLLVSFLGYAETPFFGLAFLSIPVVFAIVIAAAILRYRLFDIDIIIRKTLQYALLTGLLALVYFGSVILLQSLTENLFGKQSPFVIVLSTLAIAALFNPLRIRIQNFIDRRFYRKKYDAETALTEFAATARDEVDMEKLTDALLGVVEETVQPEKVSLWMLRSMKE